ncbi:MAG TPA: hypothetical protein QF564_07375, partial [Pirellulaceae bacterium]|nr:hypothetical protein [Pirellulaceae bacterium]
MLSTLHGRPALVVFWSTTDPVSAKLLADCNGLTERFSAAELEVVGVSLDANPEDVERWYFETGLSCRQVISAEEGHAGYENPIARFYGVEALPEFFFMVLQNNSWVELVVLLRSAVEPLGTQNNKACFVFWAFRSWSGSVILS